MPKENERARNITRGSQSEIANPILRAMAQVYNAREQSPLACGYNATLDTHGGYTKHCKGSYSKYGKKGGCFITTACLMAKGISPQESPEFQAIKTMTREHILQSMSGKRDYISYQRKAPGIVSAIESRGDSNEIWDRVYDRLGDITRTVDSGNLGRGYEEYKSLVNELEGQYSLG